MGKEEAPSAVEANRPRGLGVVAGGWGAEGASIIHKGCSILREQALVGFNKCSYNVTSNLLLNFKRRRNGRV